MKKGHYVQREISIRTEIRCRDYLSHSFLSNTFIFLYTCIFKLSLGVKLHTFFENGPFEYFLKNKLSVKRYTSEQIVLVK